jgi:hypothetical protein
MRLGASGCQTLLPSSCLETAGSRRSGGWIYQNTSEAHVDDATASRSLAFVDFTRPDPKAVVDTIKGRVVMHSLQPRPLLDYFACRLGTTKPLQLRWMMTNMN